MAQIQVEFYFSDIALEVYNTSLTIQYLPKPSLYPAPRAVLTRSGRCQKVPIPHHKVPGTGNVLSQARREKTGAVRDHGFATEDVDPFIHGRDVLGKLCDLVLKPHRHRFASQRSCLQARETCSGVVD